ncbi:NYN domain-containing protein [Patescibacteria group bacterium]|nr:NYN domain-containing protein [Patescibacteria group bacterium]
MKPVNNFAFIDSQNLNLSIRDQGWKLDFERFRQFLSDKYGITKALLFIGYVKSNESLYKYLRSIGYVLIFKPTLILKSGKPKGNVDAELVLHTMIEYNKFNKAIIVSGDGDFHCLIDHLVKNNKLCRLLIPNQRKFSSLLREFGEHITFLNQLRNRIEATKKRGA